MIYPNFCGNIINIEVTEVNVKKNAAMIKKIFMPEIKTNAIQQVINKIDWPKSGWLIKKIMMETSNKKLKK